MDPESANTIERRLDDLEREVARLSALAEEAPAAASSVAERSPGAAADDPLWFVTELQRRAPGAVMMAGAVETPAGPISWQCGLYAEQLLSQDWSELARPLEALGHPARLEIARQVLRGTHTTAELLQLEHLASSGKLYHHLRQLVAAGWLVSPRRGHYEVPGARVVPLLVLTMIAST
ncbi:helix-turn-helix transcriptional regulator [Streptomyces sp. AC495_CC817]|uniref:ArsR/SmtB family transcription factor n=1 Tax=Streptomyces sp. AC495_CC817 TaxID=2823900 RepID=UPI001C26DF6B|nr:winged helix-turn-helix domain-containing protein [Streptomyces sp. AC495_CC817]